MPRNMWIVNFVISFAIGAAAAGNYLDIEIVNRMAVIVIGFCNLVITYNLLTNKGANDAA